MTLQLISERDEARRLLDEALRELEWEKNARKNLQHVIVSKWGADSIGQCIDPETCGKQIVHIDFARKLERERDELKRWKAEMMQVGGWWLTVDEAVRKHPDAIVGHNVSDTALRFIRERDEAREANTTLQAREAELVLSKERISKRAEAIRCELVEKEKQLEAMREAIKEAHEALKTAQRQWRHYAEFRDDDNLETATHHEGRLYRTGQAALTKLQPVLKP